jgi:hypothetical protein
VIDRVRRVAGGLHTVGSEPRLTLGKQTTATRFRVFSSSILLEEAPVLDLEHFFSNVLLPTTERSASLSLPYTLLHVFRHPL